MRGKPLQMGISVYPGLDGISDYERIERYCSIAASLGFEEIFTSVHLPEQKFNEQIENLRWLSRIANTLNMQLTVDLSGKELALALESNALREVFGERHFIRLDYGVDETLIRKAVDAASIRGFVLNASVLTAKDIEHWYTFLNKIGNVVIKACHNFYPRVETGLSRSFMLEKSTLYTTYGIPVTCCIASNNSPRAPLFEGLPTVEEHRLWPPYKAALDLTSQDCIDGILIGDPFASETELREVACACTLKPLVLRVSFEPGISEEEKQIVTGILHHARPDQAAWSIRSQSSREMACRGTDIVPGNCGERRRGAVTIDNMRYGRYSGELQVITSNMEADKRVNVVAHVIEEDIWILDYINPSRDFWLINVAK